MLTTGVQNDFTIIFKYCTQNYARWAGKVFRTKKLFKAMVAPIFTLWPKSIGTNARILTREGSEWQYFTLKQTAKKSQ